MGSWLQIEQPEDDRLGLDSSDRKIEPIERIQVHVIGVSPDQYFQH